jgi:hypothetical protein
MMTAMVRLIYLGATMKAAISPRRLTKAVSIPNSKKWFTTAIHEAPILQQ